MSIGVSEAAALIKGAKRNCEYRRKSFKAIPAKKGRNAWVKRNIAWADNFYGKDNYITERIVKVTKRERVIARYYLDRLSGDNPLGASIDCFELNTRTFAGDIFSIPVVISKHAFIRMTSEKMAFGETFLENMEILARISHNSDWKPGRSANLYTNTGMFGVVSSADKDGYIVSKVKTFIAIDKYDEDGEHAQVEKDRKVGSVTLSSFKKINFDRDSIEGDNDD